MTLTEGDKATLNNSTRRIHNVEHHAGRVITRFGADVLVKDLGAIESNSVESVNDSKSNNLDPQLAIRDKQPSRKASAQLRSVKSPDRDHYSTPLTESKPALAGKEPNSINPDQSVVRCTAKRKFDTIVCGDNVVWHANPQGNGTVVELKSRNNALTRPGYRGRPRTIAANIDQLLIVNSWLPEPFWDLVDRYLIAAMQLNAEAVIIMNKSDLASKYATKSDWRNLQIFEQIGYPVVHLNALTGTGISDLEGLMKNKTSILSGRSGVGKSSIANQLIPEQNIATRMISASGEGKHTTTNAFLYDLPGGGHLIDSPGVRDYALGQLSVSELIAGYREFNPYTHQCRFHNCSHDHEPGCAVREAAKKGLIYKERLERYHSALHRLTS